MDGLDDRRRAAEDLYIRGEERRARLRVGRDRHLAHAVAARLSYPLAAAAAYADDLVAWKPAPGLPRDAGLAERIVADLSAGCVVVTQGEVTRMLREAQAAAERDDA